MAAHAEWLHTAASVQLLTYSRCQEFSSSGVRFTHQPAAAVSSLSPTRGAAEGGTPVTVLGSGFSAGAEAAGALLCRWNASVTPAAYVSESALVCNSAADTHAPPGTWRSS